MSFPTVIYGDYGDEKVTSSAKIGNLPLGQTMKLPDGREFRHAKASATALVAGSLYQQNTLADLSGSADTGLGFNLLASSAAAIGARSISVTLAVTASVTKDLFAGGYLFGCDATGQGHTYKIKGHTAAASTTTCKFELEDNDRVKVAVVSGTSEFGLRQNEYHDVTITPGNTAYVGNLAGWAVAAVDANHYCWLQRKGPCAALSEASLINGEPVVPSQTTAGRVNVMPTGTTDVIGERRNIGTCLTLCYTAGEMAFINAELP